MKNEEWDRSITSSSGDNLSNWNPRLGSLIPHDRILVKVSPNAKLSEATSLMLASNYSQLPVMDMVNGGNHGYETTDRARFSLTNIAQTKAIQNGQNRISMFLGLHDAVNKDISVTVKKESAVIATSWVPTYFKGSPHVDFRDELIYLRIEGENLGWKAHDAKISVLLHRENNPERLVWDNLVLEPLTPFEFEATIPNPGGLPVPMEAVLDWESGRQAIPIWPVEHTPSWYEQGVFRSTAGVLVAVAVLWVSIPILWKKLHPEEPS